MEMSANTNASANVDDNKKVEDWAMKLPLIYFGEKHYFPHWRLFSQALVCISTFLYVLCYCHKVVVTISMPRSVSLLFFSCRLFSLCPNAPIVWFG